MLRGAMDRYKRDLLDLMLRSSVLQFGDFTTKSGRKTPYFINTGRYRSGAQMDTLVSIYAQEIATRFGADFDVLFGPAYKGIPLAVGTAMALHRNHGRDVGLCFNRKEAKDHGEGGVLVGHTLRDGDRVVIVEDVTTAGTAIHQSVQLLRAAAKVEIVGLVVAVDRRERGTGERGALQELAATYGMKTYALLTIDEIMEDLRGREVDGRVVLDEETHARLLAYRAQYGVRS